MLLVCGTVGEPPQQSLEGSVTISRLDDGFPPIQWPVCASHFKALVYLMPGANRLRFDFASPKLANSGSSNPIHASYLTVHMVPPTNAPPLQLAILLAKDSPATFDAVPARVEREGNGLDTATRKFRMAAYLWQAFTAEQMWRGRLGRRTFRFEEEWATGTSNARDREYGSMRSEARVHIIRSDKTVADLRRLGSDSGPATPSAEGRLYDIAVKEAKEYFQPLPGQKQYVSMLVLDYNWDVGSTTGLKHVISDDSGDLQLAIFGSHCLQSYPTSFEEVVPAFTDCTPSDTNLLGNIFRDAGSSWEAATVGIGAHLHQSGHLFGLPHRERGVMARDYVTLNRSFLVREAYSTRTRSKGGPVFLDDECIWHRLDCLRFRSHPCFRLPNDLPLNPDDSVHAWPVEGGNVMVTGATGIAYLELYGEDDVVCHNWIEYSSENGGVQRQVLLVEQELRNRLPEDKRKGQLKISVRSVGGGMLVIDDFKRLSSSKESSLKLPSGISGVPVLGKTAYRGKRLGRSQTENSQPHEVMFSSALQQERVLYRIIFYCSHALHALEFVYDDDSRQLFGKRGSNDAGYGFDMGRSGSPLTGCVILTLRADIRRGEYITGFVVRAGVWIDAIQVLTSLGRRSPMFGNLHGGSV